jgi:hypothetical protein
MRVEVQMPIDLKDTFDTYNRRARLYPAFLAVLPAAVFVVLLWKNSPLQALGPVLVAVGGLFFLANFVRTLGRRLEARLIAQWDGLPTTHLLRHRETKNPVQLGRWHTKLSRVTGIDMPSKEDEAANPSAADNTYIAATRALIPLVRDAPDDFPRVQEENVNYGFRRNLLGLKPIGLTLVSVCLVIDIAVAVFGAISVQLAVTAGIQLLVLLMWLVFVNATWVFEAGQTYAERLFEALEKLDTAPKRQ